MVAGSPSQIACGYPPDVSRAIAAIETGTPAPLLTTALYERFTSRGEADFANKILSAMRFQFGGHHEKPKT